jgi:hypothetical protein
LKTRFRLSSVFLVACLFRARAAHAEASTQEKALASRLFDDASKLMAGGQAAAACPKYAESERLDPQLGTMLHLGECYAKVGKTASAWASFKEAADIATQRNDPRAQKIRDRLASIEKTLSNLVIVVADSEPATLEVRQDGAVVGKAGWGTPIPVDPGEHEITATAPNAKPREVTTTVAGNGQTATVNLPPIEYLPTQTTTPPGSAALPPQPAVATTPEAPPSEGPSQRKLVALVVGGVGVVGVGVGAAFGLMVKPTYDKSAAHCNGNNCDATGHDDRQSAFSKAEVSDIAFGVGAAALVGGAILWLTAPKDHADEKAATLTPVIGPNLAFVSVRRSW